MDTINEVIALVLRPFVAWMLLAILIGQIMKVMVWTKKRADEPGKLKWLWWWGRKSMPLHPAAVGVGIGLMWPGTIDAGYEGGTISGVLYFAIAGGLSVWAFELLKMFAKKKGYDLPDVGESMRPAPIPTEPKK